MYGLIITVKRGTAADLPATWERYSTLDAARAGARAVARDEKVGHVMIVSEGVPPHFVEWAA